MNNSPSDKPAISRQEADWHAHKAGVRASQKAAASDSTIAVEALEASTPAVVESACGWELRPVTIGTGIEQGHLAEYLDSLPEAATEAERTERSLLEMALMQMLYADTIRFRRMRHEGGWEALVAEADRLNYAEPYEERLRLAEHLGRNAALIERLAPSSVEQEETPRPGKPEQRRKKAASCAAW